MNTIKQNKIYYQALLERDEKYNGLFFVGVKTTGVFCHASCPARKPKFENCEFFKTAKEALIASYRPCQRCQPMSSPNQLPRVIQKLVAAVEENPTKRWRMQDFRDIGLDESTARRQFKNHFGMTFIEYARARRMGLAMQAINKGKKVIDAQIDAGFESSSGFHDAFAKLFGSNPSDKAQPILYAQRIETPLGPMLTIADDDYLYLLEFMDRRALENEIIKLRQRLKINILPGKTKKTAQIQKELHNYFSGKSLNFATPCYVLGSDFQQQVWQALKNIPAGKPCSYLAIAKAIGRNKAYRAVANANGANQFAIIIPCHRVINNNGELGGYGGGLSRKEWLLEHEAKVVKALA